MDCLTQARFKCLRVVFYIQVNYENNVVVEGKLLKDSLQCSSVFFFLFNFALLFKIKLQNCDLETFSFVLGSLNTATEAIQNNKK